MRGLHAARATLLTAVAFMACVDAAAGGPSTPVATPGTTAGYMNMQELEPARMPGGFASLCTRQPEFCALLGPAPQPVLLSVQQWATLASVNRTINHRIASTTDEELYGRAEYWTLPKDAGDCEDYVLLKRQTLSQLGFPLASLLITVVRDENGEGHAVLSIPTADGDLVLDNRRDDVLFWYATGYRFLKRQSAANANVWVSLARDKLQATNIASAPEAPPGN